MLPCISELNILDYKGICPNSDVCTVELTVATGLEEVAGQECREKLGVTTHAFRGRILFDIPVTDIKKVLQLRSVENVNVVIQIEPYFNFSIEREKCFEELYKFVNSPDWQKGIKIWQSVYGLEDLSPFKAERELTASCCAPKPEVDLKLMKSDCVLTENLPEGILQSITKANADKKEKEESQTKQDANLDKIEKENGKVDEVQRRGDGPKFRVSCHRVGRSHKFGSSEAARQFGGGINERFGWPVDLTNFQLEVLLNVIEEFVYVCLSLTNEPLFKRNLSFFGPTNLRSTICYNMVQLAKPLPGDFIVDPMCGGGSISIEGALTYPSCFHLGGDNFEAAVTRSRMNIDALTEKPKKSINMDVIRWDCTSLPLRDQVVDVIVCDLPFGKRIGSKADNRVLYYKSLVELARVTKVETGRAVLLTYDKKSIIKSLFRVSSLWKNFSTRSINIGGLVGGIYLLQRTKLLHDSSISKEDKPESKGTKRKLTPENE